MKSMTASLCAILILSLAPHLVASPAARPPISRFIGIEYIGKAPEGIKFEAKMGLSEGPLIGDVRFTLSRGHLGANMVLWSHERADHGLRSRAKVIDIIEMPKRPDGEAFMDRCFLAKSQNVYASGIMGIAGKSGVVVKAWGINPKTGRIDVLPPKLVKCEQDIGD